MGNSNRFRAMTGFKKRSNNKFVTSSQIVNENWDINGNWNFAEPVSAADPVDSDDLVTLGYFNTHAGLYQGVLDASAGIPYPEASEGMYWRISVAGVIGTTQVEVGDQVIAIADYAGGMDDTKFMIIQTTAQITDVTYAQLSALITAGTLEAGRHYRITDYATAYNIFDGGTNAVIEAQLGTAEPLIVLATGTTTLAKEAYSALYPQDIIHYNPLVNAVELAAFIAAGDVGFVTAGSLVAGFKGLIEFRHDTKQNVSTWYDFRNIKFRRWAINVFEYDGGTAYNPQDVCKSVVDGKIYKCLTATTGEGDPTVNTADWILWWDTTVDAYISWTTDNTKFNIGNINTNNILFIPNNHQDVYTFGSWYNHVNDVTIGHNNLTLLIDYGYNTTLNNIVFKTTDDLNTCYSNEISEMSYNNTIENGFFSNAIRYGFSYNTIEHGFSYNTIGNEFLRNTIGNSFLRNTIGNGFLSNIIGNNSSSNIIGNDFACNTIGNFCIITAGQNWLNVSCGNGVTFTNNIAPSNFKMTKFEDGVTINAVDFTTATHIKAAYNTTVFMNATPAVKLSYFNASNALTVVNVNA